MKKFIILTVIAAALMLGGPCLALCFSGLDAMGAIFILFFAVNPIFSAICGVTSGLDIKRLWSLPLITATLFLAGVWIFLDMGELDFLIYCAGYLAIGVAFMLPSAFIKARKQSKNK